VRTARAIVAGAAASRFRRSGIALKGSPHPLVLEKKYFTAEDAEGAEILKE
jgi:hypothetical protein